MNNPFETIDARLTNIECLLLDLKHTNSSESSNSQDDQLLTIKQAADFLSLSVPTIYGLVQRATIPVSKQGKRLYFSKQELMDWIKAQMDTTNENILVESNKVKPQIFEKLNSKTQFCKKSKNRSIFKKPFELIDWLKLITQAIMLIKLILEITHHS